MTCTAYQLGLKNVFIFSHCSNDVRRVGYCSRFSRHPSNRHIHVHHFAVRWIGCNRCECGHRRVISDQFEVLCSLHVYISGWNKRFFSHPQSNGHVRFADDGSHGKCVRHKCRRIFTRWSLRNCVLVIRHHSHRWASHSIIPFRITLHLTYFSHPPDSLRRPMLFHSKHSTRTHPTERGALAAKDEHYVTRWLNRSGTTTTKNEFEMTANSLTGTC